MYRNFKLLINKLNKRNHCYPINIPIYYIYSNNQMDSYLSSLIGNNINTDSESDDIFIEQLEKFALDEQIKQSKYFIKEKIIDGVDNIFIGILLNNTKPCINSQKSNTLCEITQNRCSIPINPCVNQYSFQGIKIGPNGKIKKLIKFTESDDCLIFEYETSSQLILRKIKSTLSESTINNPNPTQDIFLNIIDPSTDTIINKPMDKFYREIFTRFNYPNISDQYDKIFHFIK